MTPKEPLDPALYIVATPIGNDADITLRAIDTLRRASLLVAEDTRRARRLLRVADVSMDGRKLLAYHDHSSAASRATVMDHVAEGGSAAYLSDAGTPLIADPGYRLVADAQSRGLNVVTLPGPSAVIAALTVAGLPTDRFIFAGFLPPKSGPRRAALAELRDVHATLVVFEAPHRTSKTLADLSEVLGPDRPAALCRELTKTYEEVRRGSLAKLLESAEERPPKGEVVLVIGPPDARDEAIDLDTLIENALSRMSPRDAVKSVTALTGLPRKDVYARVLDLSAPAPGEKLTDN